MSEDVELQRQQERRGSWLRLALFNFLFVAAALGIYFMFYADARIDQTNVRNFRALDAAAERLVSLVDNLPKIGGNVPLGRLPAQGDVARDRLGDGEPDGFDRSQEGYRAFEKSFFEFVVAEKTARAVGEAHAKLAEEVAAGSRMPLSCEADATTLPADFLRACEAARRAVLDAEGPPAWAAALQAVNLARGTLIELFRLQSLYLQDLRATSAAASLSVAALAPDACDAVRDAAAPRATLRRLAGGGTNVRLLIEDCRSFERRNGRLHGLLVDDGEHAVDRWLDAHGLQIAMPLSSLVGRIAANVEPLFDQFLIVDRSGRVLYSAEDLKFRFDDVTGAPGGRRVRLDFISQLDLKALVDRGSARAPSAAEVATSALSKEGAGSSAGQDWARYGVHSRIEGLQIAGMEFAAFVHPFVVDDLRLDVDGSGDGGGETSGAGRAQQAELFMVGIVNREALRDDALRLRLSIVADALMSIGILLASFSLLWLWTAGDRLILGRSQLFLFVGTTILTTFLTSLLVLHLATRTQDGAALDDGLQTVGRRLAEDFRLELEQRLDALQRRTRQMVLPAAPATSLAQKYQCPPSGVWPDEPEGGALPLFELAFLLDENGVQTRCLSYRLFDTPPIALGFRDYFKRPDSGRLWPRAGAGEGDFRGFYIDRITSVVDGTTETVLSAAPRDLGGGITRADAAATVIIGRLATLEQTVLPGHMRFAVIDDDSGRTLFHSLGSRALATNFVRQVDGNPALLALVDARKADFVDLDYHGTSIRAWVQPLADGVPWTLVVYRGHEIEDTIGIMSVSMTTLDVIGTWVLVLIAFMAAAWRHGRRAVIEVMVGWMNTEAGLHEAVRVFGVLALLSSAALAVDRLAAGGASWSWQIGAVTLVVTPVALFWLAWRRRREGREVARWHADVLAVPRAERGPDADAAVWATVLLVLLMTLLPTSGFFSAHRADLGRALGTYLADGVRSATLARCERARDAARRLKSPYDAPAEVRPGEPVWSGAFSHGWVAGVRDRGSVLAAYPADDPAPVCHAFATGNGRLAELASRFPGEAPLRPGPLTTAYEQMTAFSGLAQDLFARLVGPGTGDGAAAGGAPPPVLPDAAPATFAYPAQRAPRFVLQRLLGETGSDPHYLRMLAAILPLLLVGLALVMATIHSLVHRVLGIGVRLELLSEAWVQEGGVLAAGAAPSRALLRKLPSSWRRPQAAPLRACVVHRSDRRARRLQAQLLEERFAAIRRAVRLPDGATFHPERLGAAGAAREALEGDESAGPTLFVVETLELFMLDAGARGALLRELEALVEANESILLCSRMIPGFWLARMAEGVTGDVVNVSGLAGETTRWAHVFGPFDVRRLIVAPYEELEARFEQELAEVDPDLRESAEFAAVARIMLEEALANPELLELAGAVTRQVGDPAFDARGPREQAAVRRFVAGAASYFHEQWSASTREERLQLYALAKGGYVNPSEVAVLSSLANRSLISIDGVVRLRSRAFARFIDHDLVHDHLLAWCDAGHGNLWKSIWPPIALLVVLAVAFFVSSTPEALGPLAALFAAGLGAVPILGGLLRSFRDLKPASA
ncbi:MAG TPA: hypothetical protein VLA56_17605 [Pseudomonadales bacterium]|nr:hypothetical protein [Pseudomonadales bacterium]